MAFIRRVKVNGRYYDQLVESYRKDGKNRTRILKHLGPSPPIPLEEEGVIPETGRQLTIEECLHFGAPATLHAVADELKIAESVNAEVHRKKGPDVGHLFEAMVINRCIDPKSRHALPEWYTKTSLPTILGLPTKHVTEDTLYAALDRFDDDTVERIQKRFWRRMKELGASENPLFYDLTSSYFEGVLVAMAKRGYCRDKKKGKIQVNLGIASNIDGLPIMHKVLEGNVNDVTTVDEATSRLKNTFSTDGIVVMDRGMESTNNREDMAENGVKYIMGVPMKGRLRTLLASRLNEDYEPIVGLDSPYSVQDVEYKGRHLVAVLSHDKKKRDAETRDEHLLKADKRLSKLASKAGKRGHKTKAVLMKKANAILKDEKVQDFFTVSISERGSPRLAWARRPAKIRWDQRCDGKFFLQTNTDLDTETVFLAYHQRNVIEQLIRTMKEIVELRPFFVRIETHVKAHVFICVTAALLLKWMHKKLKNSGSSLTPVRALEKLENVMEVVVKVSGRLQRALSRRDDEQSRIMELFGVHVDI